MQKPNRVNLPWKVVYKKHMLGEPISADIETNPYNGQTIAFDLDPSIAEYIVKACNSLDMF